MMKPFDGFDFSTFWEDSEYARREYVSDPPSDKTIRTVERELGYRLPVSYLELMHVQNGGIPNNCCFPIMTPTTWANNHVTISGILGIGWQKAYSLCGRFGSKFMQTEWGYPDLGICVCDCPSAGHDMIMLDYRTSGPRGEPEVVHVDQESNFRITFLAKNFETFIRGLVNKETFDTSAARLKEELKTIDFGCFSNLLCEIISREKALDFGPIIRNLCRTLTIKKKCFALHADELSRLVYDALFYLYTNSMPVHDKDEYLDVYPDLMAFGDGDFTTAGYAPGFVEDWITERLAKGDITKTVDGTLKFSDGFRRGFIAKLEQFKQSC